MKNREICIFMSNTRSKVLVLAFWKKDSKNRIQNKRPDIYLHLHLQNGRERSHPIYRLYTENKTKNLAYLRSKHFVVDKEVAGTLFTSSSKNTVCSISHNTWLACTLEIKVNVSIVDGIYQSYEKLQECESTISITVMVRYYKYKHVHVHHFISAENIFHSSCRNSCPAWIHDLAAEAFKGASGLSCI